MARNQGDRGGRSGRGRSGRGYGSGRSSSNNNRNNKPKGKPKGPVIPIEKLKFTIGENQAENYTRLTQHMAEKANSSYGYKMAYIIENEKEYEFEVPTLQRATRGAADSEERLTHTEELKLIFKEDHKRYKDDLQKYKENKQKLCSDILSKTSEGVRAKLNEDTDFISYKFTDPVKLIQEIKSICLNYRGNKYPYAIVLN